MRPEQIRENLNSSSGLDILLTFFKNQILSDIQLIQTFSHDIQTTFEHVRHPSILVRATHIFKKIYTYTVVYSFSYVSIKVQAFLVIIEVTSVSTSVLPYTFVHRS